MILSKQRCPDCGGSGLHPTRGGLCGKCHGEGKRRPTAAEETAQAERSLRCACGLVVGPCDGRCGVY